MEENILRKKDQALALMMTVAFTAGPFGFGVPMIPACISWAVAWASFVYVLWNLEHARSLTVGVKTAVAVLSSLVMLWIAYPPIRNSYIREKARTLSGDLIAENDGKDHSSDFPVLQVGPGGSTFRWTGSPDAPQISAYYDKIQMKMVDGKVRLSTTVRDDAKNLIVEIADNHWTVSSPTASCWDHNYTDSALEVMDGHGRVVLQVRLIGNIVQLQEEWQWNPGSPNGGIIEAGWYDQKQGIKKIFKYPSELYWGQRRDAPGYD